MIQSSAVTSARGYPEGHGGPRGGGGDDRRHRIVARALPAAAVALVAFGAGAIVGARHTGGEQDAAQRFARAWVREDFGAMHRMLTENARARTSAGALADAYRTTAATATATTVRVGDAREPDDGAVSVPVQVRTRLFGTISGTVRLPVREQEGEHRIAWAPHLTFPDVPAGVELERTIRLPSRAALLASDGTVLARGPDRTSEDPELAASIAGTLGPIPPDRALEFEEKGVPDDALVGLTGLERALDDRLRGTPGGELRAGDDTIAVAVPRPAEPVRTSIDPEVQRAAVLALAGRLGGVVALDPRTGRVRAAAGIGLSGLQPPGSTFKIITLAAALEAGVTRMSERFEVLTQTTLEGVALENANGESCGGTLIETFAHSCNSVFAPLGAELGAERLVAAAERFGFNSDPPIPGAATSTIPPAEEIGDDLAVGSSAIGQGRLQASALQTALMSATIAARGVRPVPTLEGDRAVRPGTRAVPADIARKVARAMRAVVEDGTGTAAAIEGFGVAGKTGTAELRTTVAPEPGDTAVAPAPEDDPTDTSAWFAAYAPFREPELAVAVLLVEAGAGGDVAAPATKLVLEAGLAD